MPLNKKLNLHYILLGLSIITHPVFLPSVLMSRYFYFSSAHFPMAYNMLIPNDFKNLLSLLYFLLSVVMPVMILLLAKTFHMISSLSLENIKERKYFFMLMGIYYWFVFFMFRDIYSKEIFKPFVLLMGVVSVTMFLLSLFTYSDLKISLHSAGYGILTAFFTVHTFIYYEIYLHEIIFSILLSALVMIIRILAKAHTFSELLAGWTLGLFSCISVFWTAYQYF